MIYYFVYDLKWVATSNLAVALLKPVGFLYAINQ